MESTYPNPTKMSMPTGHFIMPTGHLLIAKSNQDTLRLVYNISTPIETGHNNTSITNDIVLYRAILLDNHNRLLAALANWVETQRFRYYKVNHLSISPVQLDIELSLEGIDIAPLHRRLQDFMLLAHIRTNKQGWYENTTPRPINFRKSNTQLSVTGVCSIQLTTLDTSLEPTDLLNRQVSILLDATCPR